MAKKENTYKEQDFLNMFSAVKSEEKGRKSTTRLLVGRTVNNFRKLVKAGYTPEEFKAAAVAMFRSKDQWAVSTGNDTPEHLLQPENFGRYLNAAENPEAKEEVKKVVQNAPQKNEEQRAEQVFYSEEEKQLAKDKYSESLKAGKWLGTIGDSMKIIEFFSNSFTLEEKLKLLELGKAAAEKQDDTARVGAGSLMDTLDRMARKNPKFAMYEIAITEAVKRKIKEPWIKE